MRELQLDGIHDDGDHVVLTDTDGDRYTLRIDEALRAAVRRDRPALGMIQASEHAPLRPREIQAMLRGGRDAEEIAEIAGVGLEHVRRFEGPVLAERGYIAERARTFHVGRGGSPSLGDLVAQRLRARQAAPDPRWDAWRNDDGSWTIQLAFEAGGRTREAHWTVDMTRQSVTPGDDEARWLTDDEADPEADGRGRVRLAPVKGRVYDVEADGGVEPADREDPWGAVRREARDAHPTAFDEEELDALNARRGLRSVPPRPADEDDVDDEPEETPVWSPLTQVPQPVTGGAMPQAAPDDDQDAEAMREHSRDALADDAEDIPLEVVAEIDGDEDVEARPDAAADDAEAPGPTPTVDTHDTVELTPLPGFDDTPQAAPPSVERPKRSRSRRSSMPSWDEIVFGSKKD